MFSSLHRWFPISPKTTQENSLRLILHTIINLINSFFIDFTFDFIVFFTSFLILRFFFYFGTNYPAVPIWTRIRAFSYLVHVSWWRDQTPIFVDAVASVVSWLPRMAAGSGSRTIRSPHTTWILYGPWKLASGIVSLRASPSHRLSANVHYHVLQLILRTSFIESLQSTRHFQTIIIAKILVIFFFTPNF